MIENFPNQRREHCETGSLQNLMHYYGIELSEDLAFGIGGGLYFLYCPFIKLGKYPFPILRTRPGSIIRNVSKRMGLSMTEMTFGDDRAKSIEVLNQLVDQGIPVMLVVNVYHLPYLDHALPPDDKLNFNGHNIIVIGREGSTYHISDSDMKLEDEYYTIEEADLNITRFMPGANAPHGRLFYFDKPDLEKFSNFDYRPACLAGLKEVCKNMLDIPLPYFGPKGIKRMGNVIRQWDSKFSFREISLGLLFYYRILEMAGTGGSGYRYIYSRFLKECAAIFQDERFENYSDTIVKAADSWRAFSVDVMHYRKQTGVTLNEMAEKLYTAANYEQEVIKSIRKDILKKYKHI